MDFLKEITPVEQIDNLFLKRDDKFKPFPFSNINGSKLRQCILLFEKEMEKAKSGVIVPTSVLSPQAAIVASVAKHFAISCEVYYGGTSFENLEKMIYPSEAKKCGATLKIVSKSGRQSVLNHAAKQSNKFIIQYGIDLLENKDVLVDSVSRQTENLPNDIDNLIIPCGSAISTLGILLGIKQFNKNVKNIYCIGIAPNRESKIKMYLDSFGENIKDFNLKYIDLFSEGISYEKQFKETVGNVILHPRYEAKAFRWYKTANLKGKTLFWIVGGAL